MPAWSYSKLHQILMEQGEHGRDCCTIQTAGPWELLNANDFSDGKCLLFWLRWIKLSATASKCLDSHAAVTSLLQGSVSHHVLFHQDINGPRARAASTFQIPTFLRRTIVVVHLCTMSTLGIYRVLSLSCLLIGLSLGGWELTGDIGCCHFSLTYWLAKPFNEDD